MIDPTELILSPKELDEILAGNDIPALIDVRDRDEFATGHIPGAVNVPLTEIAPLFDDPDRAEPMIFVCESGIRSLQAANFARIAGLSNVRSIDGGMAALRGARASGPDV